jgi:hypothetical protein
VGPLAATAMETVNIQAKDNFFWQTESTGNHTLKQIKPAYFEPISFRR